jgi:hypothetical protein
VRTILPADTRFSSSNIRPPRRAVYREHRQIDFTWQRPVLSAHHPSLSVQYKLSNQRRLPGLLYSNHGLLYLDFIELLQQTIEISFADAQARSVHHQRDVGRVRHSKDPYSA